MIVSSLILCQVWSDSLNKLVFTYGHLYWKEKETQGRVFFLLILTIFYGVYYSHTLLQIVLWMWTAGIRVFDWYAIYPVCEIIQPCTTQCIARTIRKAKISCKTSMFKPSAQDFLTPFGTLQRYTTLFDSFTGFSFHFYATLNFFFNHGTIDWCSEV